MICLLSLCLLLLWSGWTAVCLTINYSRARKLGIPIVIVPISTMNILWIVLQQPVISVLERLFGQSNLTRFGSRDWHFREKAQPHIQLGDLWALVTPGQVWLNVADPDAIADIFQRRTQFVRPVELYRMLNVFGRNAATVDWFEWKQHRKIIAAPFNELANKIAWTEALNQAREMLSHWTMEASGGNLGLQKDTRTASVNVLAATSFSRTYSFKESSALEDNANYRAALATLLDNSLFMQLVPTQLLSSPLTPASWTKIADSVDRFKEYMTDLLHEEKRLLSGGQSGASHLTSSLLKASEEYSSEKESTQKRVKPLTMSELMGNIYLINMAGHDTTANTLAYAIVQLAMNPEIQEWLAMDIQEVMGNAPSEAWDYESTFKRLKRPLAIMYETLRLFPPILALPKTTNDRTQKLTLNKVDKIIPPNFYIVPSLLAVQCHPTHWGADALAWRPSRWIGEDNEFIVPRKGTYLPWSDGAQNCPGKRFSQVTFVAVITSLFQSHRVQPFLAEGESVEEVRIRLYNEVQEISHGVLLRMKNADSIKLSWIHV